MNYSVLAGFRSIIGYGGLGLIVDMVPTPYFASGGRVASVRAALQIRRIEHKATAP